MTLHELESPDSVTQFTSTHTSSLLCFSATWCGPCSRSKPELVALADEYAANNSDIAFGIVYEHKVGNECVQSMGVRAFPTYILFTQHGSVQSEKVEGVNFAKIRDLIARANVQSKMMAGAGNSLGGNDATVAMSAQDARALRLKRYGGGTTTAVKPSAKEEGTTDKATTAAAATTTTDSDVVMKDVTVEEPSEDTSAKAACVVIDPTQNIDKDLLDQLTSSMGFSTLRAQKGLLYGQGGTVEGAVEWLLLHQDDDDIDEPIKATTAIAQSYKCNECGKILSNMANLELHANKTGHSDFEESTEAIIPLTPDEKAKKVEEIRILLKQKRSQREKQEKEEEIEREKQRRFMGQEQAKTREAMEIEKRKRSTYLRKKAKDDEKRERERIRAELAKDKAERMANKGKLATRLGMDGYAPSAIQYDTAATTDPSTTTPKKKPPSTARIDEYITKVSAYRAGGDGGKCLKILLAYVGNAADKEDDKFKTINMENKVYRAKVKPFIGAKLLLLAVGFQQNESNTALVLREDADKDILTSTKDKLKVASEKY